MLGRADEAARVAALVRDAGAGRSGALLVVGEPGIGKTLLLGHARSVAEAEGAVIAEARGDEGEARLAFAGLYDLVRPLLGWLDAVPRPQADALRGALALGPPQPGDRFTTYAATLSLLAAAAEQRPVVCIIDDAHWLDTESFEGVQFVSRRLGAEGVAILIAARDGLDPRIDASPLPRLELTGLGHDDARALVIERAPGPLGPAVLDAIVAGASGNPLALAEIAGALTPEQRTGADPLPDPLPVGPFLQRALLRPIRPLPEATRRALLVLSAGDGAAGVLAAALAAESLSMADLEPAERAGVVTVGPAHALFSHPLVRAAVYQGADPAARRSAHRALAAAAVAAGEAALDRRAWHLALAASGPDEGAARELEDAARRAAARTAHVAASTAFEAAARLTAGPEPRGARLLAAGQSALEGGDTTRAARLFDEVVAVATEPGQVVEGLAGRGYVETFAGSALKAVQILTAVADQIAAASPQGSAALLVQATVPAIMRADLGQATEMIGRAQALAPEAERPLATYREVAAAIVATLASDPRTPSAEVLEDLSRRAAAGDPLAAFWSVGALQLLMFSERYDEAERGLTAIIRRARERSTPSALPLPLFTRSELRRRTGRLDEAAADALECVRLSEDTRQLAGAAAARWTLARVAAVRGDAAGCRSLVEAMRATIPVTDVANIALYADEALGLLLLGAGRPADAADHLSGVARRHATQRLPINPLMDAFMPDLAESLIRSGSLDAAAEAVEELAAAAARTGASWPAACAARCRGLMARDDAFEDHFAAALEHHARTPTPFERARSELCLGERRRRARRVREARAPLEAALATFDAIGATAWAQWARRELRATGSRPAGSRPPITSGLTPQELQVALAVGEGATNKQAAAALLISPKTVEYHLAKVYEKLGVRSRAELALRIARQDARLSGPGRGD